MKFGTVPLSEAEGGVLAHQVRAGAVAFRKSHNLSAADCAALAQAGVNEVTIARLEPGDVFEDEAARLLAQAAAGSGIRADPAFTGRANLFAQGKGLFVPDVAAVDRFNAIDPGLTLATLPAFRRVEAGEMVATIKIIPFAVPGSLVETGIAGLGPSALRVAPFAAKRVAMLSLRLPGLKESVIDKTLRVTQERLAAFGATLVLERRLAHRQADLEAALAALDPEAFDLLLIFGAAAIADIRDIIPAALVRAGGRVVHFGMPVDPGNLMLLAEFAGKPVIGAPGCARSPRENGFDWVLARHCADLPMAASDIQKLGVGGLLMEIVSRPQPRAGAGGVEREKIAAGKPGGVAAIVLAAGRSTRFGAQNKLLASYQGEPMLSHVLARAADAALDPILIVTGHEREQVEAIAENAGRFVHNPAFAEGLSTSLHAGFQALPPEVDAAFVMLADMPRVKRETLDALLAAAVANPAAEAFVPAYSGHWGNPVLVRRALFPAFLSLHGDQGARKLLQTAGDAVQEVAVDDPGILADFDTPEALARADQ